MLFSVRLSEKRRHIVSRFKGWHHRTATGVVACLDRIRCTEMEAPALCSPLGTLDRASSPVEPNARSRWPNEVSEAHWIPQWDALVCCWHYISQSSSNLAAPLQAYRAPRHSPMTLTLPLFHILRNKGLHYIAITLTLCIIKVIVNQSLRQLGPQLFVDWRQMPGIPFGKLQGG